MAARISVIRASLPRAILCASLAWPLCACESQPDIVRLGKVLYGQMTGLGGSDRVPRSQVANIPYATLGVRLGSSGEAMFVLESKSGTTLQWVGGSQFAIATRDGRILRTVGFVHNITGFVDETPPDAPPGSASRTYRYDLADMNAYGVSVHCRESDAGLERIEIVGDTHETRHILEECAAADLGWTFTNEFWKDVAGSYVWRSVQYVHPGLDPIALETLRPAN